MFISETEKALLHRLQNSLGPFENFVAKMDLEEILPLVPDRQHILDEIASLVNNSNNNVIIPLIGDVGQGKTHLCWQIKKALNIRAFPVFLEVPTDSKLFYYNLYTEMVENIGAESLRDLSNRISDLWGAQEKKFGIFRTSNVEEVLSHAKEMLNFEDSPHQPELEDCMRIIITHAIDPDKSTIAERWLLGEVIDPDELYFMGVSRNLNGRFVASELLKLLLKYLPEGILLIIDDMDETWERYDSPDMMEDDWTQVSNLQETSISASLEGVPEFFQDLGLLFLDFPNIHLLFTIKPDKEKEIFGYLSAVLKENYNVPAVFIPPFSLTDLEVYYQQAIRNYCKVQHLQSQQISPVFPWNTRIIEKIFYKSGGNPRKIIRKFQDALDYLLYDRESLEGIEKLL
ncbi:MAG: hypothetical protein ACTSRK_13600 [Promethearchaeota archaeon]